MRPDLHNPLHPLPSAAVSSDNTDPLAGQGGFEERCSLLWRQGEACMEQVEVWGAGRRSAAFLRLTLGEGDARAEALRGLLLALPEQSSGFRDLLVRPGAALAASFTLPDACLSHLAPGEAGIDGVVRPAALLRGLAQVASMLDSLESRAQLGWPEPEAALLGLQRSQPYKPAGHRDWQLQFTGWTHLVPGALTPANRLAGLLLPALDWLSGESAGTPHFCRNELELLRSELQLLSTRTDLKLSELCLALQKLQPSSWQLAGQTDLGRRRDHNEDAFLLLEQQQLSAFGARLTLAAVADGMGGHSSGEIASSLALDLLRMQLTQLALPPRSRPVSASGLEQDLRTAVQGTGRALLDRAALDAALGGMGTTLAGLAELAPQSSVSASDSPACCIFNIGDSRVYLLGPHGIARLTTDHSHVQELVDSGQLAAEEAFTHPQKNVITRCLGGGGFSEPTPDIFTFVPGPGELVLVCSDGLSDALRDEEILAAAAEVPVESDLPTYLHHLANELIAAANAAGGPDNITVLLAASVTQRC